MRGFGGFEMHRVLRIDTKKLSQNGQILAHPTLLSVAAAAFHVGDFFRLPNVATASPSCEAVACACANGMTTVNHTSGGRVESIARIETPRV